MNRLEEGTPTLTIVGYEQEGHCDHCGRALRHCIRLADGRVVGAQCFDQRLTRPRLYQGRPYRIGAQKVIELARLVQRYNDDTLLKNFGIGHRERTFEAA